jgi:protein-S-isoprenylcysteine O-methyltransferase Ste14
MEVSMEKLARIVLAMFWVLLARASFLNWQQTGSWIGLGLLGVNTTIVVLFLLRRESKETSRDLFAWTLGSTGTLLPLFLRPTATPPWILAANLLQLVGIAAIAFCLLGLGRSFGIVPANRGVKIRGAYRLVRHPLYASEILYFSSYVLGNPSAWNISCIGLLLFIQFARALKEEKFLSGDSLYRTYLNKVRFRFIPGLL